MASKKKTLRDLVAELQAEIEALKLKVAFLEGRQTIGYPMPAIQEPVIWPTDGCHPYGPAWPSVTVTCNGTIGNL